MTKKTSKDARAGACALAGAGKSQKKPEEKEWRTPLERKKRLITDRMKALGIYKPQYASLIDRTAKLYLKLEELEKEYEKSGGARFVEYTNKAGATNLVPNPYIRAIEDAYAELIVHERELGLTPAALRKIATAEEQPQKSKLALALEKLSNA